ncbi:uncharacterized protein [Lepeophtheirus salmonis]|uniref:uncharacterized protein n=1 Tax=Lepeophtheirus salmonis TaxID=72036 RepID=UPI001AE29623|nr:uncharacterized protein LOC121114034 [Lepeophtheirus salmonis]
MYPYKLKRYQHPSSKVKAKTLERGNVILQKLRTGTGPKIVFSDEKIFTVEQVFNYQNDRFLAKKDELGVHGVNKVQKLQSVMVWAAITETGKSSLVIVPAGLKINTKEYISTLSEEGIVKWAQQHF